MGFLPFTLGAKPLYRSARSTFLVMPGFMPGIHVLGLEEIVDGRDFAWHDKKVEMAAG
jgi:hypothetical protein